MKALVKAKPEVGIWMKEVPEPTVGPNEVKIKIKKTSICGTDVHIYNWDEWSQKNVPVPLVTGHEYSGVVHEIGEGVTNVKVGERVSGEGHIITNPHSRNYYNGKLHLVPNPLGVGVNRMGAFAEYLVIPAMNVYKLPDYVSDEVAAIFDPFGNAVHTALSFNMVCEDVLITGAGPIGIMVAAVCRHAGARNVVITDINTYRLDLAKKLDDSITTVNVKDTNLNEVMTSLDIVEGFDVGLEMSGNLQAFQQMIDAMIMGGRIAMLGIFPGAQAFPMNEVILKGLFLKGIYGREMFETWYKMGKLVQTGLDLNPIITHHFPAEDYQKAFDIMRSGESGKVILDWA